MGTHTSGEKASAQKHLEELTEVSKVVIEKLQQLQEILVQSKQQYMK